MAARKTTRSRTQRTKRGRAGLGWTLVSTALLATVGFAAGLFVGAVWETPDQVLPLLRRDGETLAFAPLGSPGGDTAAPANEQDAGVPARPEIAPTTAGRAEPPAVGAAPPDAGPFSIQVGSFTEPVPAWKLAEELGEKRYEVYVDEGDAAGKPRWRVRIGPVETRRAARGLADRLKSEEGLPTWILAGGNG
ncbi:MAG: SPOR domain-containing protein [Deltaproteobacteria bacterium]|nr:SPOR domain-containing protein [Deltaproteobacteria bacterium]